MSQPEKTLREYLQYLSQGLGVRKLTAASELGEDISRLWGIDSTDDPNTVRDKVAVRLKRYIEDIPDEKQRLALLVSYNLADYPELRQKNLQGRRQWLAAHEREPSVPARTTRRHLERFILVLEERLLEELSLHSTYREPEPEQTVETFDGLRGNVTPRPPDISADHDQTARTCSRKRLLLAILAVVICFAAASVVFVVVENQPGSDSQLYTDPYLAVTLLDLTDNGSGWSIALPSDKTKTIDQFLDRVDRNEPTVEFFDQHADKRFLNDALDAGAYVLGRARLQIELEGEAGREVTIYNVRIVPVGPREEIATGAAILFPQGAGPEPRPMVFNLDDVHPIAKELQADGSTGRPFFDVQRISLAHGYKDTLLLWLGPGSHAHSFNVAIDYEVGGIKRTKLVTRNGSSDGPPFRVSSSLCLDGRRGLSNDDLSRLRSAQYGDIRIMVHDGPEPSFVPISHSAYLSSCGGYGGH